MSVTGGALFNVPQLAPLLGTNRGGLGTKAEMPLPVVLVCACRRYFHG